MIVTDHAHINGGAAKVAIGSALGLADAGLSVTFFAPSGPVDDRMRAAGVNVVCLDQPDLVADPNRWRAMGRGLWNSHAARELKRVLAGVDPESSIVHCHGFSRALSPAVGPLITRGPLPHVYTMHEYFLACPNGAFFDFSDTRICERHPLGLSCLATNCDSRHGSHKAWRVVRHSVLHSLGNMPKGLRDVIYISETQLRVMGPYLGPSTRLHHVRNPVEIEPGPRVHVEENDVFLFIGRLVKEKAAVRFARAAAEAGVRAVFVGDGPEAAAVRDVNPCAEVTGWLPPAEVEAWLGRARCLVFPSLWYETLGLAPLEALSRGVPVICGGWSAAAESVEDGVTGTVYTDPADLRPAIEGMSRERAGRMSRSIADRQGRYVFSVADHVSRLLEVYGSILGAGEAIGSGSRPVLAGSA